MKKIDKRVLDIDKADLDTKLKHDETLLRNVVERILSTPDEEFDLIDNNCVSLKINDIIEIMLRNMTADIEISISKDGFVMRCFLYEELYTSAEWSELEKEKQDSEREMLQHKIERIREIKLEVTEESKKYMAPDTKSFYAVFDAISGDFE